MIDRYREERGLLIQKCLELSAPLEYSTDGSAKSAMYLIQTYVESLERRVDKAERESREAEEKLDEIMKILLL